MFYTIAMLDPTLLHEENVAPGVGVPGKMLRGPGNGWGGLLQKDPRNSFEVLDKKNINGIRNGDLPSEIFTTEEGVSQEKNLAEFYETPTDLMTHEDRVLVNPRELAKKLLAKVEYEKTHGADMLEFFLSKSRSRIATETHYAKDGSLFEREKVVPNAPPMFSEFGRTIGVSDRTIKSWVKKYPEFAEAYEICQDIIQEFFVENGVKGNYASQFSIFAAKNLTRMKDVMVNKNENYDMKSILDAIERGQTVHEG